MTPTEAKALAGEYQEAILAVATTAGLNARLTQWPRVQALLEKGLLYHRRAVQAQPEARPTLLRFRRVLDTLQIEGGYKTTEREAAYLSLVRLAEKVLSPHGWPALADRVQTVLTERAAAHQQIRTQRRSELDKLVRALESVFPKKWGCQFRVAALIEPDAPPSYLSDVVGMSGRPYDGSGAVWDGQAKTLTIEPEMALQLADNLANTGVMTTLVGRLLPVMLAGSKPVVPVATALQYVAALAVAMGAKDTLVDVSILDVPEPPDVYRGHARAVLRLLWREPRTFNHLQLYTGIDAYRLRDILRMIRNDETAYNWRLTCEGELYRVQPAKPV